MIKARVSQMTRYIITIEGTDYECYLESEWEGMACFEDIRSRKKIILDWNNSIIGQHGDEANEHLVIKTSPDLK